MHQVILNLLVTKDFDNKDFDHIDPWGETIAYIAWAIRAPNNSTIMSTSGQAVFGREMIFNLSLVIDWRVITTAKQLQADIDNVAGNARQVTHDYAIGLPLSFGPEYVNL